MSAIPTDNPLMSPSEDTEATVGLLDAHVITGVLTVDGEKTIDALYDSLT